MDIARERGHSSITDILAPVIYHPVLHSKLAKLQELFHETIRQDFREMSMLVLPELVALTELRVLEMGLLVKLQRGKGDVVGHLQVPAAHNS